MKEECFELGAIQAFLDGELTPEAAEKVSLHLITCGSCALMLAEAEDETALAFSVLEQEFDTLVPTHRLWAKINDSINREKKSFWQTAVTYIANFKSQISNQTIAAFASLLIVVGLFAAFLILQSSDNSPYVSLNNPNKQEAAILPASGTESQDSLVEKPTDSSRKNKGAVKLEISDSPKDKKEYGAIKTVFTTKEKVKRFVKNDFSQKGIVKSTPDEAFRTTNVKIAGEESYINTIAALTETVNNRKDDILKPSARFAFEKDIAVVDDAIEKMRAEVKKNPKNEGARQVLLASYQNKIDLLSSVAEKNELMASLR